MANLCIIPARGGSKRIPRKNIRAFLGKPIIAYSIEAALESNLFDEVMVSTDDDEIAEIALRYGANVPFLRSKENANDCSTTFDVIEEVLESYQKKKLSFEQACCLYPCAPFIRAEILEDAHEKLDRFDTVFPIVKYSFPIQRALERKPSGATNFIQAENALTRSQDLKPSYHDAGQFYWFNVKALKENKSLISANLGSIILSELEVQDIDNETDWKLAELKYRLRNEVS